MQIILKASRKGRKVFKMASNIPLFKKGKISDLNNYRPISIIPVVAKLFERIVYNQLIKYLDGNKLISHYQSGFRSLHSTATALLDATDDWTLNIDQGKVNAVVFLHLKKAFDTVNHKILLDKLWHYGVIDLAYQWFTSYLNFRQQKVYVNGAVSTSCSLKCGIP